MKRPLRTTNYLHFKELQVYHSSNQRFEQIQDQSIVVPVDGRREDCDALKVSVLHCLPVGRRAAIEDRFDSLDSPFGQHPQDSVHGRPKTFQIRQNLPAHFRHVEPVLVECEILYVGVVAKESPKRALVEYLCVKPRKCAQRRHEWHRVAEATAKVEGISVDEIHGWVLEAEVEESREHAEYAVD